MKSLRLGTRQSALAQVQAQWVAGRLRTLFPDLDVETVLITTSGDLRTSGGTGEGESGGLKALFTKEIEEALLDNRIDLAVHSLKDMSAVLPKGLIIGAIPEREDPRDAWISKTKTPFGKIPKNAKIGTGAVRRQAQLKRLLPEAQLIAMRGNVDTRLRKLAESEIDGIILALAGLKRLGRAEAATEAIPVDVLVPAVGQGCLGIQVREEDRLLRPFLKALDHPASHAAALAERAFLKGLGGSCQTPIAGHAALETGELILKGLVISPDGKQVVSAKENGRPFDAEGIGARLAQKLLEAGADKILRA
jgi:hydroxymethylbilane synthase